MRRIEIVTFPDGQLLDVAGPLQAFASCNHLLAEQGLAQAYATAVCAGGRRCGHDLVGTGPHG